MEKDITNTGPVGLKGLKGLKKPKSYSDIDYKELAKTINFNTRMRDDKNNVLFQPQENKTLLGQGYGESKLDSPFISTDEIENLNNYRGNTQSGFEQVMAGIAKGGILAATTFVDNTAGFAVGALYGLLTGEPMWSDPLSKALKAVTDWSEKAMPNYYTDYEQNAPWYKNIFTTNFLGDKLLKNVGYVVGSMYSGGLWSKGAMSLIKGVKAISKAAPTIASTVGTTINAIGEASNEALINSTDWMEEHKAKLDLAFKVQYGDTRHLNPEQLQIYNASLERLAKDAAAVGNVDFLLNVAVLTFTEQVQFGRLYAKGFKTATRNKNIGKRVKDGVDEFYNKMTTTKGVLRAAGQSATEGAEEALQAVAGDISKDKHTSDFLDFYNAQIDPEAEQKSVGWLQSAANSTLKTLGKGSTWEEFTIGALLGFLGVPQFRSGTAADGSKQSRLTMGSGSVKAFLDYRKDMAENDALATELTNRVQDPKFLEYYKGMIRNNYFEQKKAQALENDDEFEFRNSDHAQLLSDIITFDNAGRLEDLQTYADIALTGSDENVKALIERTTAKHEDGSLTGMLSKYATLDEKGTIVSKELSPAAMEDIHNILKKGRNDINTAIQNYEKHKEAIETQYGKRLNKEQMSEIVWMRAQIPNWESRSQELLSESFTVLNKSLENAQTVKSKIDELKSTIDKKEKYLQNQKKKDSNTLTPKQKSNIAKATQIRDESIASLTSLLTYNHVLEGSLELIKTFTTTDNVMAATMMLQDEKMKEALYAVLSLPISGNSAEEIKSTVTKLVDMVKLQNNVLSYHTKLKGFLETPSTLTEKNKEKEDAIEKEKTAKDTEAGVTNINNAQTLQEFREELLKITDPEIRKEVLTTLKKEGNELLKTHEEVLKYTSTLSEKIMAIKDSIDKETFNDIITIFNSMVKNAESVEDIANLHSVIMSNRELLQGKYDTEEKLLGALGDASYILRKLMLSVNTSSAYNKRLGHEYVTVIRADLLRKIKEDFNNSFKNINDPTIVDTIKSIISFLESNEVVTDYALIETLDGLLDTLAGAYLKHLTDTGIDNTKAALEVFSTMNTISKNISEFYRDIIEKNLLEGDDKDNSYLQSNLVLRKNTNTDASQLQTGSDETSTVPPIVPNDTYTQQVKDPEIAEDDGGFYIDDADSIDIKDVAFSDIKQNNTSAADTSIPHVDTPYTPKGRTDRRRTYHRIQSAISELHEMATEFRDFRDMDVVSKEFHKFWRYYKRLTTEEKQVVKRAIFEEGKPKTIDTIKDTNPASDRDGSAYNYAANYNEDFTKLYGFLKDKNAFSSINDGKIKIGDEVEFVILPEFNALVENESWYDPNKPVIFMRSQGQIIGILQTTTANRYKGLPALIDNIHKSYNSFKVNNTSEYKHKIKTNVAQVLIGRFSYIEQENNLTDILTTEQKEEAHIGIVANGMLVTDGTIPVKEIEPLVDIQDKEGHMYLMVKNAKGTYSLTEIRARRFTKTDYLADIDSIKDTTIYKNIMSALDSIAGMLYDNLEETKTELIGYIKTLNKALYINNIIFKPFKNENGTCGLHIYRKLNGQYDGEKTVWVKHPSGVNTAEQIKNSIIEILSDFNVPIQVSKKTLGAKTKQLIESRVFTTNLESVNMRGGWVTMDYIYENKVKTAEQIPTTGISPTSTKSITNNSNTNNTQTTNVSPSGVSSPPSVLQNNNVSETNITYNNVEYIITDLTNNVVTHADGTVVDDGPTKEMILLIGKTNKEYGNNTNGVRLIDNKVILNDGRVFNRNTQKIHQSGSMTALNTIAAYNKRTIESKNNSVIAKIEENKERIVSEKKTSTTYTIKNEDGVEEEYTRVTTYIGDMYKTPTTMDTTKYTDAGTSVDTVVRDFFHKGTTEKPSNLSEDAYNSLLKALEDIKQEMEDNGEQFHTNNIIVFGKDTNGNKVAGEIDILVTTPTGNFKIYDIKTSVASTIGDLYDTVKPDYNRSKKLQHALQLNTYAILLQQQYGVTVSELKVIPFHLFYENNSPNVHTLLAEAPVVLPIESYDKLKNSTSIQAMYGTNASTTPVQPVVQAPPTQVTSVPTTPVQPVVPPTNVSTNTGTLSIYGENSKLDSLTSKDWHNSFENIASTKQIGYYKLDDEIIKNNLIPIDDDWAMSNQLDMTPGSQTNHIIIINKNGNAVKLPDGTGGYVSAAANKLDDTATNELLSKLRDYPGLAEAKRSINTTQDIHEVFGMTPPNTTPTQSNTVTTPTITSPSTTPLRTRRPNNNNGVVVSKKRTRKADKSSYEKWDKEQELAWLDTVLPQMSREDKIRIVESLINVENSNAQAWGMVDGSIMILSNMAAKGTVYHEAYHIVFNNLLSETQRTGLLKEARKKFGNKSDLELEEDLAEYFREYVESSAEKKKSFIEKIGEWFKNLLATIRHWLRIRPSIESLHYNITSGKFANKGIKDNKNTKATRETRNKNNTDTQSKPAEETTYKTSPSSFGKIGKKVFDDIMETIAEYEITDKIRFVNGILFMDNITSKDSWDTFSNNLDTLLTFESSINDYFVAFHNMLDMFTTSKEYLDIIKEGIEVYKSDDTAKIEESLSKDFKLFMLTNTLENTTPKIKQYFKWLQSALKNSKDIQNSIFYMNYVTTQGMYDMVAEHQEAINREKATIEREKHHVKYNTLVDGSYMLAPNKKSTRLSEDQWLYARTEYFKNKYGDWQSPNTDMALDKNGEPVIDYFNDSKQVEVSMEDLYNGILPDTQFNRSRIELQNTGVSKKATPAVRSKTTFDSLTNEAKAILYKKGWTSQQFDNLTEVEREQVTQCIYF